MNLIYDNLNDINNNIKIAAEKSGYSADEITLVGVTKTIDVKRIKESLSYGICHIGENKAQEVLDKYDAIGDQVTWHFIGHLQRNKVKYIIDKVNLIHSVDSIPLANKINEEAIKNNLTMDILIQVNVAGEERKYGIEPRELEDLLKKISELPNVQVKGLMTIAPYVEEPEENRLYFRELKQLSVDIASKKINNIRMDVLSMGMTNDYMIAIEEGATMVRVGTGIFGVRNYSND